MYKITHRSALFLIVSAIFALPFDSLPAQAHPKGLEFQGEPRQAGASAGTIQDHLPPIPDGARLVVETPRFRFVTTPGLEGLANSLSSDVESLRDRISEDLGVDYQGVTEIRIADRSSTFQHLQPYDHNAPTWAVGVAWPLYNVVVLNTSRGRKPNEIRTTLAHEISHIALGRLAPKSFPRWFLEGMAIYHSEDWAFSRAGSIAGAVMREGIMPMKDLETGWPTSPAEVRLAYAQSIDFVSWLFRQYGRETIHDLISNVVAEHEFEEAVEIATGKPLWRLEYDWRSGLSFRYTWVPAITSGGFLWGITSLLFLWAYVRKKRAKKQRLEAMAAEEEWLYAPDEDIDIQNQDDEDRYSRTNDSNGSTYIH